MTLAPSPLERDIAAALELNYWGWMQSLHPLDRETVVKHDLFFHDLFVTDKVRPTELMEVIADFQRIEDERQKSEDERHECGCPRCNRAKEMQSYLPPPADPFIGPQR